jgi:hypothetical protein
MTLNKTLQQIKASSRSKMSAETLAIMGRAIEQLKDSGIVERALGPGRPAPGFHLPDWQGRLYASREILAKGPLILTFYRGSW